MFISIHSFRPALALDTTVFHRDGSRTVIGEFGSVTYAPDGSASFSPHEPDVRRSDTIRHDLDIAA